MICGIRAIDTHPISLDQVVATLKVLDGNVFSKVGLGADDGLANLALIILLRPVHSLIVHPERAPSLVGRLTNGTK